MVVVEDSVDARINAALSWCATRVVGEITLAIPFLLSTGEVERILEMPEVASVVLAEPTYALYAGDRVGEFLPVAFSWRLPKRTARRLVYVGSCEHIRSPMIRAALIRGVTSIVFWNFDRWVSRSPAAIAASRLSSILSSRLAASMVRFAGRRTPNVSLFVGGASPRLRRLVEAQPRLLPAPPTAIPGRIVMACPTLVAGGAERQIGNTVVGLRARGHTDVQVLVSNLFSPPGNDFFLDRLVGAGAEVSEVQGPMSSRDSWKRWGHHQEERALEGLGRLLRGLPPETSQEIANLYFTFRSLRPSVVHAWLDHSCVCAGLAALMAGVPRVVLSGRNVSPIHFPYILKPIMRPAYRAMATRPESVYLNNSRGGANDYAFWLGLEEERFRVLYNGIDSDAMRRATSEQILEFRQYHGVPEHSELVGGMFRLSAEKRPELWIDTLLTVAAAKENVYGLLFGAGPLQAKLEARIARAGVADRVRMVPPTRESDVALSAFDVLLLASRWEGTPNVAIEAQAVGTPVVLCGGGGAGEALLHGVTGLFVEHANADELSAALLRLLDDPAYRGRLADAGPRFVSERFGLNRMVSETLEVYGV